METLICLSTVVLSRCTGSLVVFLDLSKPNTQVIKHIFKVKLKYIHRKR